MPTTSANGIEICYETFGNRDDPALLLVMGYTAQMISWDERLVRGFADRGRYVIRFDNRDCGLSTCFDGVEVDVMKVLAALDENQDVELTADDAPYTLSTFSDDAFGLLDHLGVERAHIVGASMGGMIVQTMAVEHPERVLSMTSIMSSTGEQEYGQSTPEARAALLSPPPEGREAFIEFSVRRAKVFASPRYFDEEKAAQRIAAAYDRAYYPEGAPRQLAAILASDDRVPGLAMLETPTLVIHGRADTLIDKSGGERTAELIKGANLMILNDMGHDLPEPLWPLITDAIISHTTL